MIPAINLIPKQKRRVYGEIILVLFISWLMLATVIFLILNMTTPAPLQKTLLTSLAISFPIVALLFFLARKFYVPDPKMRVSRIAETSIFLEKDPDTTVKVERGIALLKRKEITGQQGRGFEYEITWKNQGESREVDGSSAVEILLEEGKGAVEVRENPLSEEIVLIFPALKLSVTEKSEIWVALAEKGLIVFLTHHKRSHTWALPVKKLLKIATEAKSF